MIHLATEEHLTPAAIARRVGVHRHTVESTLKRYHDTGTIKERAGRGRKRKITTEDEKKIFKKSKQGKNATEIAREYERETKMKVSESTVRNIIHDHQGKWMRRQQVEALTPANKAKRLAYAQAMKNYNWKKVLFSDEKVFFLGAAKTHAYQQPGKRKKYPVIRHPPKLNVWAAAGTHMRSKLYFFNTNMDAELYQKVIKSRLRADRITFSPDCPVTLPQRYHFLQDNAKPHKAKESMAKLAELVNNRIIEHPAQSPDLNPLEDLWSYLDRKVKAANIKSIQGLKQTLTHEWENLPWSYIRDSVKSMPRRLVECVELAGGRTHY